MKKMLFFLVVFYASRLLCSEIIVNNTQAIDEHVQQIVANLNEKNEVVGNFFQKAYREHKYDLLSDNTKRRTETFFQDYVTNNFSLSKTSVPYISKKKDDVFIMRNVMAPLFLRYVVYEAEKITLIGSKNALKNYISASRGLYDEDRLYVESFNLIFPGCSVMPKDDLFKKKYDEIPKSPISIQIVPQQNTNQLHVSNEEQKPELQIASDDYDSIMPNVKNHLNIVNKDEMVVFAVGDEDLCAQNEIFKHYMNNKYDINVLISFARENRNNQNLKSILAPLFLYEIINGRFDNVEHNNKVYLVNLYDANDDMGLALKRYDTDTLYELIYKQFEYAWQVQKLQCRYNIALCNLKKGRAHKNSENIAFLKNVIEYKLTNSLRCFDWINVDSMIMPSRLSKYLELLSQFESSDHARTKFCELFVAKRNDIFFDQGSLKKHVEYVKKFFKLPKYKDNFELTEEQVKHFVQFLKNNSSNISYFLGHTKEKYPDIFSAIFINLFDLSWCLKEGEGKQFWLSSLTYFNTLNCGQKISVSEAILRDGVFYSDIGGIHELTPEQLENLLIFINKNIEYKGNPVEYVHEFKDNLNSGFLVACKNVGFIDDNTKFGPKDKINAGDGNHQNNAIPNNVIIEDDNDPQLMQVLEASMGTLNNDSKFDDDTQRALKASLQPHINLDNDIQRAIEESVKDDNPLKSAFKSYQAGELDKSNLVSFVCSFIPCSDRMESNFLIDNETYESLCPFFGLNIGSSYVDIRRAAIKIACANDIGKICNDLMDFNSYTYGKKLHDIDLFYGALEWCKNNQISVLASKIKAFYENFNGVVLEPRLDLTNIINFEDIDNDTLALLRHSGIIALNRIKIELNHDPNPLNPQDPDDATSSSEDNQLHLNQSNVKKSWYENKYLLGGVGLGSVGLVLLIYLIAQDYKKFTKIVKN